MAKTDKVRSEGSEVAQESEYLDFEDGLDAVKQPDGGVKVGIKDGGVAHSKTVVVEARTATADGTGTGQITATSTFITVTSASATNAIKLPAAAAAYIGRKIDLHVAANGYELLSGADGDTINTVDADGTNQLDVAANTLIRAVQVTATGWVVYQVAATTITVVAPDND